MVFSAFIRLIEFQKQDSLCMSNFTFSVFSSSSVSPSSGCLNQTFCAQHHLVRSAAPGACDDVFDIMRCSLFVWFDVFDIIKWSSVLIAFRRSEGPRPHLTLSLHKRNFLQHTMKSLPHCARQKPQIKPCQNTAKTKKKCVLIKYYEIKPDRLRLASAFNLNLKQAPRDPPKRGHWNTYLIS